MDDLTPTVYPQHITRPSKTQEALPYRNNPYKNNPYEIAPPPPAPIAIEKIMEVKKYGPLKLVIILGCVLILFSLVGGYEIGRTEQAPSSQAVSQATLTGESADYRNGYDGGYTAGYNQGNQDGQTAGQTAGQNQALLDLYDFLVNGNTENGKPCLKTSDQPDFYYFQIKKDGSGAITYDCLTN